ncbi:MAG: hypothetical protein JNJ63_11250 [Hyphomonadaceae bacterium]|nr:hypothetical protein [Hyphomonadaceae bacterium]
MSAALFSFDFRSRVVLDTNLLANATFVRGGMANRAVDYLARSGAPTYIPMAIEDDLKRRATKLRLRFGLNFDPVEATLTYARQRGLLFYPHPAGDYIRRIGARDEPLARSAQQLAGVLITDDIKLVGECRAAGIAAVQPWEIARSYRGPGELPALLTVARALLPAPEGGYLFARIEPGDWKGLRVPGVFTVADAGQMSLRYEAENEKWVFELPKLGSVALKRDSKTHSHFVICGQYKRDRGKLRLELSIAEPGQRPERAETYLTCPSPTFNRLELNIGHSSDASHHWNGNIRDVVMADGIIATDTFRRMAASQDLSPNPHDGNRLEKEIANLVGIRMLAPTS